MLTSYHLIGRHCACMLARHSFLEHTSWSIVRGNKQLFYGLQESRRIFRNLWLHWHTGPKVRYGTVSYGMVW